MKKSRIVLTVLLALLLVCSCLSALADTTCSHLKDDGTTAFVWKEVKAATCTAKGEKQYVCSLCQKVDKKEEIPMTAHIEGEWETEAAPTCDKDGTEVKKCTVCGKTLSTRSVAKLGHDITVQPWTKVKDPTCKEAGREARICTRCNKEVETREIPKLTADADHTWVLIDEEIPATCEKDGKTAVYQCSVCGSYKGGKVIKGGHKAGKDWIIEKEATCTKEGKKVLKCTVCNAVVKSETIKATGHNVVGSEWVRVKEPTCKSVGREAQLCQVCKEEVNTRKIPKLTADSAHTWVVIDKAIEVTCDTDGKTAQEQCTVCGAVKGGKVIKAKGHKNTTEVTLAATCTTDGSKRITCSVCGKVENVKIPATGHKGEWKVIEKPTEKQEGLSIKLCKACGFELDRRNVPFTKMLYNNTICAFGPETRSLVGGKDWYRVTPVDLTQEGTQTYDLIASNAYVVGTATVTVANGTLTVSYQLNSKQIQVRSEDLIIYPNVDALRHPTPATAGTYTFDQPIDIKATFGEDEKVLVSVFLKADYDQIGSGVSVFRPDQAKIDALSALVD